MQQATSTGGAAAAGYDARGQRLGSGAPHYAQGGQFQQVQTNGANHGAHVSVSFAPSGNDHVTPSVANGGGGGGGGGTSNNDGDDDDDQFTLLNIPPNFEDIDHPIDKKVARNVFFILSSPPVPIMLEVTELQDTLVLRASGYKDRITFELLQDIYKINAKFSYNPIKQVYVELRDSRNVTEVRVVVVITKVNSSPVVELKHVLVLPDGMEPSSSSHRRHAAIEAAPPSPPMRKRQRRYEDNDDDDDGDDDDDDAGGSRGRGRVHAGRSNARGNRAHNSGDNYDDGDDDDRIDAPRQSGGGTILSAIGSAFKTALGGGAPSGGGGGGRYVAPRRGGGRR